jgi:hypothetical protein
MYYEEPDWTEPHKFRYRYNVEYNARVINKPKDKYISSDHYQWELVKVDDPKIVFQLGNKEFNEMFEMSPEEEMVEIPKKVLDAINVVANYFGYHDYSNMPLN